MKRQISKLMTLSISIIILSIFNFSCEPPTEAETTGNIQGVIYDASSSQPLGGATITTDPTTSSKITDTNGSFLIEGIEPGDYSLQVTKIGYQTNTTTVKVIAGETASADLQLSPVEPELSVSTTDLDFSASSTSIPFTISNSGEGTLDWAVSENATWITVNPTSGSITSNQSSVTVSVDRSGLSAGDYSESISVSSNGGSATITVTMTVEGPVVAVSNNSLNFGTATENLTFNITNSGIGTVNYNIVYSANWLTVNPTSGSATTETDVINVSVNRNGLAYGNYFETMTVTSNTNSVTVDVMMTVPDPNNPQLSAYPTTLDFENTETNLSFYISNTGSGLLTWNITDDKSWISVNNQSGTTETETNEITVTIDRLGQSPGTYTGTVTVSSDGGNQNINISMSVPDEPSLSVSPDYLDFGSETTALSFDVANAGTGDLSWSVSDNQAWITTNPTAGTNYGTVNVTVSRDGISPGDYSGTVTVSSNGGTDYVEISMNMPADEPPTDVELLSPSDITENSMSLNWTRNFDSDFAAYKLYRDLNPAVTQSSELITTITNSAENYYTDTGLQASTTYYYRVYVMDMANQHTASNVVSATTLTQLGNWSVNATLGTTLYAVDALNENFAFAVGDNGVIFYYNGSEWTQETSPTTSDIKDVEIISQTDIWAVGNDIYHYDGINWSVAYESSTCYSIDIVSANDIYVGSSSGKIYHYDGSEWTYTTVNAGYIKDIQMDATDSGWAVDEYGKIFYYNGYGWSLQIDAPYNEINTFNVFNASDIWLGKNEYPNELVHWDGSNWLEYDTANIYDSFSFSSSSIWFVGQLGEIHYWNGNELQTIISPTSNSIYGIFMMSETDGWAVGDGGVVLRYH